MMGNEIGGDMNYTHPKEYEGIFPNTPNNQAVIRLVVEKYCIGCSEFMGREHDFSECKNCKITKCVPLVDADEFRRLPIG